MLPRVLVRAQETAAIISERYDAMPVTEPRRWLPGKQAVLDWLGDQPESATVALVGHEPDLESRQLAAQWTQESFISLKKGAGCLIELTDRPAAGDGKLVWLLPPAALRKQG
jgi:phosphohistidine phosphatase